MPASSHNPQGRPGGYSAVGSDPDTARDLYFSTRFLLYSIDAWEHDRDQRGFDLAALTDSFRESVPVLDFLDWKITAIERGYAETLLPLTLNASNQYITHQAALMLLAADYTGGGGLFLSRGRGAPSAGGGAGAADQRRRDSAGGGDRRIRRCVARDAGGDSASCLTLS